MAKLHFRPYIPNQTVLFPQRIDENIAATDPVRIVNAVIDNLNLESFKKLYKETGRCPYHPKMMLKVIIYAYMNNIYSCRKIEKHLLRDIHYILKSATKLFSVLLASKRPLITELADKLRLKYPLLPTISPCPTMRLEAIRSIIPISCRRYPKSV